MSHPVSQPCKVRSHHKSTAPKTHIDRTPALSQCHPATEDCFRHGQLPPRTAQLHPIGTQPNASSKLHQETLSVSLSLLAPTAIMLAPQRHNSVMHQRVQATALLSTMNPHGTSLRTSYLGYGCFTDLMERQHISGKTLRKLVIAVTYSF